MPAVDLGGYEVLARLGAGGMAHVFLARAPTSRGARMVCLKCLIPEMSDDEEFLAMFLDEARLLSRFRHPNLVEALGYGVQRGLWMIALELVVGHTVWSLIDQASRARRPVEPAVAAVILAQAADGLHHAHEQTDARGRRFDVVHRDISPQNLMVGYGGRVKVLDFGVAKARTFRPPTEPGVVKGRFSYMSPEQIKADAVDRRSDVFALGVVLHETLTGQALFRGRTPQILAARIIQEDSPRVRTIRSDVGVELDAVCAKALARDPDARFQSAAELARALRTAVGVDDETRLLSDEMARRFGPVAVERRRALRAAVASEPEAAELVVAAFSGQALTGEDPFHLRQGAKVPVPREPPEAERESQGLVRGAEGWWMDLARTDEVPGRARDPSAIAREQETRYGRSARGEERTVAFGPEVGIHDHHTLDAAELSSDAIDVARPRAPSLPGLPGGAHGLAGPEARTEASVDGALSPVRDPEIVVRPVLHEPIDSATTHRPQTPAGGIPVRPPAVLFAGRVDPVFDTKSEGDAPVPEPSSITDPDRDDATAHVLAYSDSADAGPSPTPPPARSPARPPSPPRRPRRSRPPSPRPAWTTPGRSPCVPPPGARRARRHRALRPGRARCA
jgi:hypothetical protein